MKIALVCRKYGLGFGGKERYTVFLSRELVRLGHEVHLFAHTAEPAPGMCVHRVSVIPLASPVKNLSFAWFCRGLLAGERFDIIHSMERILHQDIYRLSDGIHPVQLRQRYPNRAVRQFKAMGPRRLAIGWLERRIFLGAGAALIMANSNLLKGHVVDHYGTDPERIEVIYNGVDLSRFHPRVGELHGPAVRAECRVGKDAVVMLFVSNDFKLKRLRTVLEAMAELKDPLVTLLVIGNDDPRPYERWAVSHGLRRQVRFLGPRRDMERYYGAADLFVLPSLYDAFANVCLEAMACGLPVITSDSNGASELIENGTNGYIVKARDASALAARITTLLPREARRRIGSRAALTAQGFTGETHMARVLDLYRRAYGRSGR